MKFSTADRRVKMWRFSDVSGIGQLKCDGTRAENRFRLSAKRTSPFKSAGGRQFSRLLAAEVCASSVVMLDTPCSEVVWRVLVTHSIRQFPLHFPSRASPCAITFQLESTNSLPFFRVLLFVWWHHSHQSWFTETTSITLRMGTVLVSKTSEKQISSFDETEEPI